MTSFSLSTFTTTPQTLVNGEFGQIAPTGGILAPAGSGAVSMSGNAVLQNFGTLLSPDLGVGVSNGTTVSILNGETGQIGVSRNTSNAINVSLVDSSLNGSYLHFANEGLVPGTSNTLFRVESTQTNVYTRIGNSGTIENAAGLWTIYILFSSSLTPSSLGNSGTIRGGTNAIYVSSVGMTSIVNSGLIETLASTGNALSVVNGLDLRNSGTLIGNVSAGLSSSSTLRNSGDILGNVTMGGTLRNSGLVDGNITFGNGSDLLDAKFGRITGTIELGGGDDTVIASDGTLVITDTGGVDQVRSTVSFELGLGVENLSLIGVENIAGTGNELGNNLTGNAGNNRLAGRGDADFLDGGAGDNLLRGNQGNDVLFAQDGDDTLQGGTGDDWIFYSGGNDQITGGLGIDGLYVTFANIDAGVTINLSVANSVQASGETLRISGIENVFGAQYADSLTGNLVANVLDGGEGNDTLAGLGGDDSLYGGDGNDSLSGGAGNDMLIGGIGQDTLSGSAGADQFVFDGTGESPAAAPDRIVDFGAGDRIDLTLIDAVPGDLDNAFAFIGTAAFSGTGPQLRYQQDVGSNTTTIQARLDGSASPDLVIVLNGLVNLTAESFWL